MLTAFIILVLGIAPSLVSVWVMHRADARVQARLRSAVRSSRLQDLSNFHAVPDQRYVQGMGYIVGDITCRFNARSSYLRCAVNPIGPCEECSHYETNLDNWELHHFN